MYIRISIGLLAALVLVLSPVVAHADVEEFSFKEFTADYYLSRSGDGGSELRVVEKLVAVFPENYDQNKGIIRAIPSRYDGHSVGLKIVSLTRNGLKEPIYSQDQENGHLMLATGSDDYLHGEQTYEITYTLRDVIKDFGTHQELYWDTNGTEWEQQFGRVSARLHLEGEVAELADGRVDCYVGQQGSSTPCQHAKDGNTLTFQSNGRLRAGENLTLVVGFSQDSFVPYQRSPLVIASVMVSSLTGVLIVVYIVRLFLTRGRSAKGRGTIVPEYLPPRGVSLMMASVTYGQAAKNMLTAQLIDLAVRHKVQIIETDKKGLFGKSKQYAMKLISSQGLTDEERALLDKTTGLVEGSVYEFKPDGVADAALFAIIQKIPAQALEAGYFRKVDKPSGLPWLIAGSVALVVACLIVTVTNEDYLAAVPIAALFATLLMSISIYARRPLTDKGVAMRDYLKGMKMYISVGELERLKILQSPQGAEKTSIDTTDGAAVVKLYEKMLPYAVLFGLEKEWAKTLEVQYQVVGQSPDWYSGTGAFQASMIGSFVGGFSSSVGSSMSSSSSGLGGGGYSGGGGGGGGGGGR